MKKIIDRLVDTDSLVNVTNGTTVTGASVIAAGVTMTTTAIPHVQIAGAVVIAVGFAMMFITNKKQP